MTVVLRLLPDAGCRGVPVASRQVARLLAVLAGELRAGVSSARIAELLWPDEPPAHPAKAVQVLVSRARNAHGAALIVRTATGYRLALDPAEVDVTAAELALREATLLLRTDPAAAQTAAAAALRHWDEAVPAENRGDPLDVLRAGAEPTRAALERVRGLALEATGDARAAFPLLPRQPNALRTTRRSSPRCCRRRQRSMAFPRHWSATRPIGAGCAPASAPIPGLASRPSTAGSSTTPLPPVSAWPMTPTRSSAAMPISRW